MPAFSKTCDIHDATIRTMRRDRFSWDAIAQSCGVQHRSQIIDRARLIGVPEPDQQVSDVDDDRAPMPAGSAETWHAINAGLSIEGSPYPYPL